MDGESIAVAGLSILRSAISEPGVCRNSAATAAMVTAMAMVIDAVERRARRAKLLEVVSCIAPK